MGKTTKSRRWRVRRRFVALFPVAVLLFTANLVLLYRVLPVPLTPLMVLRLFEGEALHKDWVGLDAIAPAMVRAVIASEDTKFCFHHGFDWQAIGSALDDLGDGEGLRGGSTISQQTAKNVWLWPGRSWLRKGFEAYFTVWIELLWPKSRIIEVYLNVIEFGPGLYGVESAARHLFGKTAATLSAREAALLAAVLPNPRRLSAAAPSAYVRGRTGIILSRMPAVGDGDWPPCIAP